MWLAVDPRKKLAVSLLHHSTSVADPCGHDRTSFSASQLTGDSVCLSQGGAVLNRQLCPMWLWVDTQEKLAVSLLQQHICIIKKCWVLKEKQLSAGA